MKFNRNIIYFLILLSLHKFAYAQSFTVVGHTQHLASDKKKYEIFIKEFNSVKSDYIFFLGDSNLGQKDIFKGIDEKIKKKYFLYQEIMSID